MVAVGDYPPWQAQAGCGSDVHRPLSCSTARAYPCKLPLSFRTPGLPRRFQVSSEYIAVLCRCTVTIGDALLVDAWEVESIRCVLPTDQLLNSNRWLSGALVQATPEGSA